MLGMWAVLLAVAWSLAGLDRARRWPGDLALPQREDEAPAEDGLRIVVPARDEASLLPRTLPSLLAQLGGRARVVLVDDGSSDGTGEVAAHLAASSGAGGRLVVVAAGEPPAAWSGKVHAMARGLETAAARDAEWLLFCDADIRMRPGAARALLHRAAGSDGDGPYDLVSVMARLHAASFWERVLVPPFVFFFQWLYPFRLVGDPRSRVAAAAGGCLLVRREALERAGGLEALAGALIDDVALARRVGAAGGRLWLGLDAGIESLRVYRYRDLWAMVSRCAFDQLGYRGELLALTLLGLGALCVAPPVLAAIALARLATGDGGALVPCAAAALAWGLQAWQLLPAVRHHGVPARYALALPLAAVVYGAATAASAWRHHRGRGALWRGRRVGRAPI